MLFRNAARRCVPCVCGWMLVTDWLAGRRVRRGDINTDSGRRHSGLGIEGSLNYIERVYRDYLAYAQIERFHGRICEIGPGDNFGVALLALADGAEHVTTIDRFYSRRDPKHQEAIYRALVERYGLGDQFDGAPTEQSLRNVNYCAGQPAEEFFKEKPDAFDFIISRAVLEHLYDPLSALNDMASSLKRDGMLVHRVDMRDHGMFIDMHPLTFLTIPEPLYRRMVGNSGRPNRILLASYRNWLDNSGLEGDFKVTRLAGATDDMPPTDWNDIESSQKKAALAFVKSVRRKLATPFKDNSDEDLAVSGIVLRAWKR